MTDEKKRSFIINVLFILILAGGVYVAFTYLLAWLFPFIVGGIVALALRRPIDWLTAKTKISRTVWSVLLVVVTFAVLVLAAVLIFDRILTEVLSFIKSLPEHIPAVTNWLSGVNASLQDAMKDMPDDFKKSLQETLLNTPVNMINSLAGSATAFTVNLALSMPELLISTIITIVACCFVTKDYYMISGFIRKQVSAERWDTIVAAKNQFTEKTFKMLRGYVLIMFITFAELAIGLSLLQIKYAVVIALLISLVDIMPVLGTGTVMLPWGIISIAAGKLWHGVGLLVVYVLVTAIRYVIEPRIIGKQVGLPPIVTLFSMFLGLRIFGFAGLFGFPMILIVLKNLQDTGKIRIWK